MGDEDIIEKATAEALRGFHSRGYSPNNSRLILVGGFPRNIREKVENIFGEIPQGDAEPLVLPVVQKLRRRKDIHVTFQGDEDKEKPERDSADIHIQFIVPPITEKASNPIKLAAFILGGSQSSGLYRRLREEKCLCYAVDSAYDGSVKHGKVSLYTKVPSVRQNEAIGCIFDVIDNLKRKGAPPEEVEDAKRRFIYNRAKYSETNTGIAATLEIELETGVSHAQYLEMLRAVTPEQVNRAFNEYFPSLSGKYIMMRVDPLKVNGK